MEPVDPVHDSLEDFYGEPEWPHVQIRKCGLYRVPGGKVKCHIDLMDTGRHYGNHRGYDKALRQHTWKNDFPADMPMYGAYMGMVRRPCS